MQMSTADVSILANKCDTLMASDVHQISLFNSDFVNKLIKCTYPFIFKIYFLPYMSWFDWSILRQLILFSNNKAALNLVDQFVDSLDYSKPVTSYHIPEFSQLVIPLDNSQYTLLATKHSSSIGGLTLLHVKNIKLLLIKGLELTDYAIQLAAINKMSCCFYWLIPNQVRPLVEDKLNQVQLELWSKGIVLTTLLPVDFYSSENVLQQEIFNFLNINLGDPMKV